MWEWLKKADNLKAVGTVGSAIAGGYGAYQTSKAAKKALAFQKSVYNRGVAKENEAQNNFTPAFSSFEKKEKKDVSIDLGV